MSVTQQGSTLIQVSDVHHDENESHVSKHSGQNLGASVAQDDIKPCDSVSNIGSRWSGKRSSAGSRSSVSTTSSARIKAEADMAALMARQRLLKDKHTLEEQEELLRKTRSNLHLK